METKFTKGKWEVNHWENNGNPGVCCIKKDNGINYFSGDAIQQDRYRIVSPISFEEHNNEASFEGAHIADINDRGGESKANAKLIAAAPELFEALNNMINAVLDDTGDAERLKVVALRNAKQSITKATE